MINQAKRRREDPPRQVDRGELRHGQMAELRAAIDAALKRRGLAVEYDPYMHFKNMKKLELEV